MDGYVTKDEMWAAVPFGKKYMVIHNGEQIQVFNTLDNAKAFIAKQTKPVKPKVKKFPKPKPGAPSVASLFKNI